MSAASNRRSEPDGQLRITQNVYDLLVKAKRERNELRVGLQEIADYRLRPHHDTLAAYAHVCEIARRALELQRSAR